MFSRWSRSFGKINLKQLKQRFRTTYSRSKVMFVNSQWAVIIRKDSHYKVATNSLHKTTLLRFLLLKIRLLERESM